MTNHHIHRFDRRLILNVYEYLHPDEDLPYISDKMVKLVWDHYHARTPTGCAFKMDDIKEVLQMLNFKVPVNKWLNG